MNNETIIKLSPFELCVPQSQYSEDSPYPKFWFGETVWVREREHLGTANIWGINYKNEKPWEYVGWWYIVKFAKQQEAFSFYSEDKIYPITKVFE